MIDGVVGEFLASVQVVVDGRAVDLARAEPGDSSGTAVGVAMRGVQDLGGEG